MPSNVLKSLAKKAGINMKTAEKKWEKAKEIVKDKIGLSEKDKKFYPYVTTIFKKMLKLKENEEFIFTSKIKITEEKENINENVKEGTIFSDGKKKYVVTDVQKNKVLAREIIKKGNKYDIGSKIYKFPKELLSYDCKCFKILPYKGLTSLPKNLKDSVNEDISIGIHLSYIKYIEPISEEAKAKIKELCEGRKPSNWPEKAYKKAKKGKVYSGAEIAKMGGVSKVAVQKELKKIFDKILKQLVKEFDDLPFSTLVTHVAGELGVTNYAEIKKVLPKWAIDKLKKEYEKS